MSQTPKIIPDIALELPADCSWYSRDQSPLALGPDTDSGLMQISAPAAGRFWRGYHDLDSLIRRFVAGANLGNVLHVEVGEIPYGRCVSAECMSEDNGDICAWLVVPETHDPLCITWIAETPAEAGRAARRLVTSIRCGLLSSAVAAVVCEAQKQLATSNSIPQSTCFFCDATGEIVAVDFSSLHDEQALVRGIRDQRARLNASVVTRQGMAEVRGANGASEAVAFAYAESRSRRKLFLLPVADNGRKLYEVDAGGHPVSNFFVPPLAC